MRAMDKLPILTGLCQVPECGLSCAGCCINPEASNDVLRQIIENSTAEITDVLSRRTSAEEREAFFRTRNGIQGTCENVVFLNPEKTQVGCAAHPLQNDGIDYRAYVAHCVRNFVCWSSMHFDMSPEDRQTRVLHSLQERFAHDPIGLSKEMGERITLIPPNTV